EVLLQRSSLLRLSWRRLPVEPISVEFRCRTRLWVRDVARRHWRLDVVIGHWQNRAVAANVEAIEQRRPVVTTGVHRRRAVRRAELDRARRGLGRGRPARGQGQKNASQPTDPCLAHRRVPASACRTGLLLVHRTSAKGDRNGTERGSFPAAVTVGKTGKDWLA